MDLAAYQRAVLRVSLDREPAAGDLDLLGDAPRFLLYRSMIRQRLEGMAQVAYRRTLEVSGEAAFSASFARFLAVPGATSSPYIREVVASYGRFAQEDSALSGSDPEQVCGLLAFERAVWEAGYLPARIPSLGEDGLRELDFDGAAVLNPVLFRLTLPVSMWERCDLSAARPNGPSTFSLLVYRSPRTHAVRWWAVSDCFARLIARFQTGTGAVAHAVRDVAQEVGGPVDPQWLEGLASDLTLAVERGVLLGVRG